MEDLTTSDAPGIRSIAKSISRTRVNLTDRFEDTLGKSQGQHYVIKLFLMQPCTHMNEDPFRTLRHKRSRIFSIRKRNTDIPTHNNRLRARLYATRSIPMDNIKNS
ncbi:hypothetical protein Tco_1163985 [Tanacetum coccineum]